MSKQNNKPEFTRLVDLAAENIGGQVLVANDEFFASKDALIKSTEAVFIPGKYTEYGKWMDGWETRRRRSPGHDWCIIKLAVPGIISGFDVDTSHFIGNHPPNVSIEAAHTVDIENCTWHSVLPNSPVFENTHNYMASSSDATWTHVRLNIHPDGGVARLRVYGVVVPSWPAAGEEIELSAIEYGGRTLSCSDEHFGTMGNLLVPSAPANMGAGWETRRRRGPGHDWVILEFGTLGTISRIELDTTHFKGNYPDRASIDAAASFERDAEDDGVWVRILEDTELHPDHRHVFESFSNDGKFRFIRLNIYPDGGIARIRVFGTREVADG